MPAPVSDHGAHTDAASSEAPWSLEHCRQLDAADPLRALREQFELPSGVIYLDGNSLGPLPRAAIKAVEHAQRQEWGQGLIRSWNSAGWMARAQAVGDRIATLVGAGPGELVVADSTSINLYKVLHAALRLALQRDPLRRVLLTEQGNFPTDLYIAQEVCDQLGLRLQCLGPQEDVLAVLASKQGAGVAAVMLTQVNYRSGALHDMAALNRAARAQGVLTLWDLAHSAGALPVVLKAEGAAADFAVGCGYKYLNGGPGAPAFVWAHPDHVNHSRQPLVGWLGHSQPFAFSTTYTPAQGIARYVCGTPPILSLTALQAGVESVCAAEAFGGLQALRRKSLSLTGLFMRLVQQQWPEGGLRVVTPQDPQRRGSQVSLACEGGAHARTPGVMQAIMQALIARRVIGDFRAGDGAGEPDLLRFGFAPLYNTHEEVWLAVQALREVWDEVWGACD